ncbi:ABC transporter permease [Nocardia sp. NPDC059240]|uniref:ABC transporter permease n=1 Tax=Nocardia sp. NPDC059240 TaxID=3346786 RepID=UPI003681ABB5
MSPNGFRRITPWLRQLTLRLATLVLVLGVVFATVAVLPGGGAGAVLGRDATPDRIAAYESAHGMDRPLPLRFWSWLTGLLGGDLGTSLRGTAINEMLATKFPNTLLLGGTALALTTIAAITVGAWWFLRPKGVARLLDPITTSAVAVPEFVVATMLVFVFALGLGWLPAATVTDATGTPDVASLVLPVLALAIPQSAWNIRVTRAALGEAASLPHVHAAELDGLPPRHILIRHVLPVAAPTIAASLATSVGMLLGGTLVVESVFNYPGLGSVLAGSVTDRDPAVVAAVVALAGTAITGVLLAADLVRAWSLRGQL